MENKILYLHPRICWETKSNMLDIERIRFEQITSIIYSELKQCNNLTVCLDGFKIIRHSTEMVDLFDNLDKFCAEKGKEVSLTHVPSPVDEVWAGREWKNVSVFGIDEGLSKTISIDNYIQDIIQTLIEYLKEHSVIEGHCNLHSSGLHANMYIFLGRLLFEPELLFYTSYCIYSKASQKITETIDAIICPSRVSLIFGTVLGMLFNCKIIYYDRLGPDGLLQSITARTMINKGMKLLFISDMVVSGTEIKVCKGIVYSLGAEIVNISTVLSIEGIRGIDALHSDVCKSFNYKVWTERECLLCQKEVPLISY